MEQNTKRSPRKSNLAAYIEVSNIKRRLAVGQIAFGN